MRCFSCKAKVVTTSFTESENTCRSRLRIFPHPRQFLSAHGKFEPRQPLDWKTIEVRMEPQDQQYHG